MGYLDKDGLAHLWGKITNYVAQNGGGAVDWENVNGRPDLSSVSSMKVAQIVLLAVGWASDNTQTVDVTGILADENQQLIIPVPKSESKSAYISAGIECVSQAADSLTFQCASAPTEDIRINVFVFGAAEVGEEFVGEFVWWSPQMTGENTPEPFVVTSEGKFGNISSISSGLGGPAWALFGGSDSGTWMLETNTRPTSITIDLGKTAIINGFKMKNAPQRQDLPLASGNIYGSSDGTTWERVTAVHTTNGETDFEIFDLDKPVQYRYFKLSDITPKSGNSSVCLWDFYFHRFVKGAAS